MSIYGTRHRKQNFGPKTTISDTFESASFVVGDSDLPSGAPEVDMTASYRDRTGEFLSAVKMMQGRPANGHINNSRMNKHSDMQKRSQFTLAAKQIGKDLANTCSKVEKLVLLTQKQSLFDDRGPEIQELTYIVRQDLNSLNQAIAHLQEFVKNNSAYEGNQSKSHSNSIVLALQTKLASMSNDFRSVLEERTESLKKNANRREQYSSSQDLNSPHPGAMGSSSLLIADDTLHRSHSDISIDMRGVQASQQNQQMSLLIDQQDEYLQNRADTMRSIDQAMVDLGVIFQQLATIVKEQDEMVHRIDANVEETSLNVEGAHAELLKFFKSVSSNRWLMVKVFGVLIVFFVIFVVFLA